ncbi:MAG: DUF3823 domain-containing protein [Prevotella sp.]|nr:DUF3823 domain-containing protein [Prevotella sp.]
MITRHFYKLMIAVCAIFGLVSCQDEYDNYDAPSYMFSGQLFDEEGDPFPFDGAKNLLIFFQSGYGKKDTGMGMAVNEEGKFSQLLFNADYKLTLRNQTYPFEVLEFPRKTNGQQGYDSIAYYIDKNVTANFTVRPFYKIKSLTAEVDGKNVKCTFTVKKIVESAPSIKRFYVYLGTSNLVNSNNKCTKFTTNKVTFDGEQEFSTTIPLSYYRNKNYGMVNNFRTYAFYRVALMLDGYNDFYIFSPIQKIEGLNDLEE